MRGSLLALILVAGCAAPTVVVRAVDTPTPPISGPFSASLQAVRVSTIPPPTTPPPTTAPPAKGFGDGTYRVGVDISAGRYHAPGPSGCYWARLRGFSGTVNDIVANDFGTTHVVVDIASTDAGFETNGCGTFTPYTPPAAPVAAFGDGDWVVNQEISAGTYQAPGGSGCYWARVSGFGGTVSEIIANDFTTGGSVVVTVSPTDAGFITSGCTSWTRIGG